MFTKRSFVTVKNRWFFTCPENLRFSRILEAGCGVGAQTVRLAKNSPDAKITSIDISEDSIKHSNTKCLMHQNWKF